MLHLSGYDVSLDDLKSFRQWGSNTPGHPERDTRHDTPGVEITTGPLGQGFANGVGMAMAERFLREHFGREVQHHHIFAICSDGDLMEGIASEAASLAGHLRPRPARLPLRRQRHLDRRPDGAELRHRGRRRSASRPTAGTSQEVDDVNDLDALERGDRPARCARTSARR